MYVWNQSGPTSKVGAAIVSSNCNIVEHNLQGWKKELDLQESFNPLTQ
jgi:hypothetical protein